MQNCSHRVSLGIFVIFCVAISLSVRTSQAQRKLIFRHSKPTLTTKVLVQTRRKIIVKCCGITTCTTSVAEKGRKRTTKLKLKGNETAATNAPESDKMLTSSSSGAGSGTVGIDGEKGSTADSSVAGGGEESKPPPAQEVTSAPALVPGSTAAATAHAVGYTGRTAGEDGDYGNPDAPASAPAGGGGSTVTSEVTVTTPAPALANGNSTSADGNSTAQTNSSTAPGNNSAGGAGPNATAPDATQSSNSTTPPKANTTSATNATGVSNSSVSQNGTQVSTVPGASNASSPQNGTTDTNITTSGGNLTNISVNNGTLNSTDLTICKDDGCNVTCEKDPIFFPGNVLTVPGAKGKFYTICNKKYFYGTEMLNHKDANKACCAMGMALSSFETRVEQDCITSYNSNVLKTAASYWLGATDLTCDKKFKWCVSGEPLSIAKYDWISGQPNYFLQNEHCMLHTVAVAAAFLQSTIDTGLNDKECLLNKYPYICEEKQ